MTAKVPMSEAGTATDGNSAVKNNRCLDALRNGGFNRWQLRSNAINGVDDVGARLAKDHDGDRRRAVQVPRGANVLRSIGYVRNIDEPDCGTLVASDNQRLELVRAGDLVVGDDVRGCSPV